MLRAPLFLPAVAFVGGILAARHGHAGPAAAALCAGAALAMRGLDVRAGPFVALVAGMLLETFRVHGSYEGAERRMQGTCVVTSEVRVEAWGRAFTCAFVHGPRASMSLRDDPVLAGERLSVAGILAPFDDARNPGEPSPRELARERGIDARLERVRLLARAPPDARDPRTWMPILRERAARLLRRDLPEPYASILAGELWGERAALPPELRAEFQDSGTVHVLVTAGLHLGVVAVLVGRLAAWAASPRAAAAAVTIAAVWLYAWFSGGHLPSLRAAVMIAWGLAAHARGVAALSWNNVGAAMFVVAGLWPQSAGGASFALSFSCVGAIVLFADPLAEALERAGVAIPRLREALALTAATQIGVWPLTAATFLLIAPYALLANAAVVPCVGLTMVLGLAQLACAGVPALAAAIANLNSWLLLWIVAVVRAVARLPFAHIIATPPPPWTLALYDGAMLACAWCVRRKRLPWAAALAVLACALVLWPPRPPRHDLRITVLDVGQADAIAVQTPRGHALLVDAGGRLERGQPGSGSPAEAIGERIVVPFLIRAGLHRLDAIVLSHPHGDHAGGMAPVLRALGANTFADSGQRYGGHAYQAALRVARERGIPMVSPRAGVVWQTDDGLTLRFLAPQEPFIAGTRNDINNNSLAFMLEYHAFRMLFTGDAGAEAEARLLAADVDLRAAVLKVGHHGSAYSSTPAFIAAVQPRYAIVSAGRHNLFGHPAAATIATLRGAGARIYRTDEDGAVTIATDGMAIHLDSMQPR